MKKLQNKWFLLEIAFLMMLYEPKYFLRIIDLRFLLEIANSSVISLNGIFGENSLTNAIFFHPDCVQRTAGRKTPQEFCHNVQVRSGVQRKRGSVHSVHVGEAGGLHRTHHLYVCKGQRGFVCGNGTERVECHEKGYGGKRE